MVNDALIEKNKPGLGFTVTGFDTISPPSYTKFFPPPYSASFSVPQPPPYSANPKKNQSMFSIDHDAAPPAYFTLFPALPSSNGDASLNAFKPRQ